LDQAAQARSKVYIFGNRDTYLEELKTVQDYIKIQYS
ncbi:unnamed protein product, partial [marine sediment metagenome]